MSDDREVFKVRREAGLKSRHEKRLESATYTAAEVKILTAKARQEAAEEIAQALEDRRPRIPVSTDPHRRERVVRRSTLNEAARVAREIGSKEALA